MDDVLLSDIIYEILSKANCKNAQNEMSLEGVTWKMIVFRNKKKMIRKVQAMNENFYNLQMIRS